MRSANDYLPQQDFDAYLLKATRDLDFVKFPHPTRRDDAEEYDPHKPSIYNTDACVDINRWFKEKRNDSSLFSFRGIPGPNLEEALREVGCTTFSRLDFDPVFHEPMTRDRLLAYVYPDDSMLIGRVISGRMQIVPAIFRLEGASDHLRWILKRYRRDTLMFICFNESHVRITHQHGSWIFGSCNFENNEIRRLLSSILRDIERLHSVFSALPYIPRNPFGFFWNEIVSPERAKDLGVDEGAVGEALHVPCFLPHLSMFESERVLLKKWATLLVCSLHFSKIAAEKRVRDALIKIRSVSGRSRLHYQYPGWKTKDVSFILKWKEDTHGRCYLWRNTGHDELGLPDELIESPVRLDAYHGCDFDCENGLRSIDLVEARQRGVNSAHEKALLFIKMRKLANEIERVRLSR